MTIGPPSRSLFLGRSYRSMLNMSLGKFYSRRKTHKLFALVRVISESQLILVQIVLILQAHILYWLYHIIWHASCSIVTPVWLKNYICNNKESGDILYACSSYIGPSFKGAHSMCNGVGARKVWFMLHRFHVFPFSEITSLIGQRDSHERRLMHTNFTMSLGNKCAMDAMDDCLVQSSQVR